MNGIPSSASLAAAARTDAALALATDELARLRLMTHSPHQPPNSHQNHQYNQYAADCRKVAPMVPPKPRKSNGGEDVPFQPQTLPRKDPPAYHEPHIFEPTPSQYYCVSSNGEKNASPAVAAPQQPPKAMPQVCTLYPASSKLVVGTTGARFGLAVSRSATAGTNLPPPPLPPPLPPPNQPQPQQSTLHKAEPARVDSNGYGIVASGTASKAAPMAPPSVCRQCPGVVHSHLPPNYADSSNYSCTDYSNSANYGNSSNYSSYSNYADYENINSGASVASYSSFNDEDLPPPPPPEPPSMYTSSTNASSLGVVGTVCNGHRSSIASVYSTATPPPPPPPPPPLSVASGSAGMDDCASCCSYGHSRNHHHQQQHQQQQQQTMRSHYGHNYPYQSPPSPAPSAASAATSSSAYAELRRVGPLMVPPPPPYPSTSATTGTNSSPAPSVAGSVYGGSGQYRSGSARMQDTQVIYDPSSGSRAGSRLSGYSGGYGVLPGSHLGPGGVTSRTDLAPSGSMSSLSTLSAISGLGGSKLSLGGSGSHLQADGSKKTEVTVDALTDLLVQSMNSSSDPDFFGMCQKCGKKVVGEGNGCTAMDNVYHVQCFRCSCCDKQLEGKPFYAVDAKPYCDQCYLETLEKCSVCVKPIMDRILRATGKPYHPKCFCCIVCGKCLDGIPFTVDAHNRIHCIEDFHKKFAPRCSVCQEPIMPEPGEEETVRVVALDRSFHVKCYRCEDCGLALSSEAEGRGCYPLDGHVLCKSCNAKRVQALTSPKLRSS